MYCHLQDLNSGPADRVMDQHKATYNPHHQTLQPKMFDAPVTHQEGQLDRLQREFLDSTQRESFNLDLVSGLIAQEYSDVKNDTGYTFIQV